MIIFDTTVTIYENQYCFFLHPSLTVTFYFSVSLALACLEVVGSVTLHISFSHLVILKLFQGTFPKELQNTKPSSFFLELAVVEETLCD